MKKIYKILSSILIICMTLSGFGSISANAAETPEGYVYTIADNKVTITGYKGSKSRIIIPDIIDGLPVSV